MMDRLYVSGDGRARGHQHGEARRPLVKEHLTRWKEALSKDLGCDADGYMKRFLEETDFLPVARKMVPDLVAELEGISEGAAVPFHEVLVRMLSDEEPWYRRERKIDALRGGGCTSIGQSAGSGRPALVAQNMDVPAWWNGHQMVLQAEDPNTGISCMVVTVAGKISLAGINSAGMAIACNTLAQLDYSRTGLAEDLVVRGFLAHSDFNAGLAFLQSLPHASGQNYTIAGPGSRAINLECSARSVHEFRLPGNKDFVFHTNHPLANPDTEMFEQLTAGLDPDDMRRLFTGTSHARFQAMSEAFAKLERPLEIEDCKAILSIHQGPVCRHGEIEGRTDGYTLASLVMECSTSPKLHITRGPPCEATWQTFEF